MYGSQYFGWNRGHARPRTPSPDFEANPLTGWKHVSDKDLNDSDLHPSHLGKPRLNSGPYESAVKKSSWVIPQVPHPLSLLLEQVSQPKFCSSTRWIYSPNCNYCDWLQNSQLMCIKVFSQADGSPLGSIGALNLEAVRKLATASPFGLGPDTVYDHAVRRGTEVRAEQLHFGLALPLANSRERRIDSLRDGAWYFNDIAYHVGRYLFPSARALKLVLYKLAMYTPGGHFKMHKDTTHADSHVGTLLIGCGIPQDDEPGDEEWEPVNDDSSPIVRSEFRSQSPTTDGYSGGELVILNDFGEEARYHIRPGQVLAFCTDVPHAVAVVTSGVKITLQFDIYLEDDSVPRDHTVACVNLQDRGSSYNRRLVKASDDDTPEYQDDTLKHESEHVLPPCAACNHPGCAVVDEQLQDERANPYISHGGFQWFNHPEHFSSNIGHWRSEERNFGRYPREAFTEVVDRFIVHLLALLRDPSPPDGAPRTVAFLLSHKYRKRSICPEYLKTVDDVLYRALVATGQLKIILHHVTFEVDTYYYHPYEHNKPRLAFCPPYAAGVSPKDIVEPVLVLNRPGSDVIALISEQDEAIARGEIYVGNEASEEHSWYVAGAMFVSLL